MVPVAVTVARTSPRSTTSARSPSPLSAPLLTQKNSAAPAVATRRTAMRRRLLRITGAYLTRRAGPRLQVLVENLRERVLGGGSDVLLDHLPPLEQEEGRDALHAEARGDAAVVVDVQFADADLAGVVLRQLLEDRGDHP